MYQVYGLKNVLYYHVGSPRYCSDARWGETFDTFDACQSACDLLTAQHGVNFLMIYPREVATPQRNNFDDDSVT